MEQRRADNGICLVTAIVGHGELQEILRGWPALLIPEHQATQQRLYVTMHARADGGLRRGLGGVCSLPQLCQAHCRRCCLQVCPTSCTTLAAAQRAPLSQHAAAAVGVLGLPGPLARGLTASLVIQAVADCMRARCKSASRRPGAALVVGAVGNDMWGACKAVAWRLAAPSTAALLQLSIWRALRALRATWRPLVVLLPAWRPAASAGVPGQAKGAVI